MKLKFQQLSLSFCFSKIAFDKLKFSNGYGQKFQFFVLKFEVMLTDQEITNTYKTYPFACIIPLKVLHNFQSLPVTDCPILLEMLTIPTIKI